jgi:hypothetical protein
MLLPTERYRQALLLMWQRFLTEPLHPGRLLAGSVILGVIVGVLRSPIAAFPYIIAGGELISKGITEWSGNVPAPGLLPRHSGIIASIVVMYIVAPWLIYQGLRLRTRFLETGSPRPLLVFAVTILGGACLLNGPSVSFMGSAVSFSTWRVMTHDQEVSLKRDELTSSAVAMGAMARKMRAAPLALWSRPWDGARPLSAAELKKGIPARQKELFPSTMPWEEATIVEGRGPDSLVIRMLAGPRGADLHVADTSATLPEEIVRVVVGVGPDVHRVVEVR